MISDDLLSLIEKSQKLLELFNPNNLNMNDVTYIVEAVVENLDEMKELAELMD